ncbi:MAG: hypothetical protein GKR94_34750 [Gammaproteobacteria bacterium]|nr:hypothetical protein [Gammaproteobacteria bacterium]
MERDFETIGGAATPVFYPSVSCVSKNMWSVIDHIDLLVSANHPQFLVSCFDAYKSNNSKRFHAVMRQAKEQYQTVLWDSGIYEVVWSRSKRWCKNRYLKTLQRNKVSYTFSYDEYCLSKPNSSAAELVNSIKKIPYQVESHISPIVHCPDTAKYPEFCREVSEACNPKLIAIPERELGQGVIEIAKNIRAVRKALNNQERYQNLHILGTGNPISMMLYAFSGADSFDGLDWCQTVVDYETATLHHPLQLDLYKSQSPWGADEGLTFFARCYMHNLAFYEKWMSALQKAIIASEELDIMRQYLSESFVEEYCSEVLADESQGEEIYGAVEN